MSEALTTGWEPDVPGDDTLARAALFATADRAQDQAASLGGRVETDDVVVMTDTGSQNFFLNTSYLLQPPSDDVFDRLLAFHGGPFTVFSLWPTPDLRRRGLQLMGHPPFMVRPAGGDAPADPAGLEIEEVADAEALLEFERTLVEGYPMPDLIGKPGGFYGPSALGGPSRFWIGREDGNAVAVAGVHTTHGVNNVEWVATRGEVRGKGYGAALTWRATLADPALPAALISSDDGRSVYARMGYLPVMRWTLWFRA